jgi:hypothetical protein
VLECAFLKSPAGKAPLWVVVVGDTCLGEQGMATIGERLARYRVYGGTHGFHGIANFPLQIADQLPL